MFLSSALTVIIIAGGLALFSQSGLAPGLDNERLTACPDKPNCICSEYAVATDAIVNSIQALGGQIQHQKPDYFASTFSSTLFGFVDDLEIRIDPKQNQIHIRSAARVGYSDFGVNKKRVIALKSTLKHHLNTMTGTTSDQ